MSSKKHDPVLASLRELGVLAEDAAPPESRKSVKPADKDPVLASLRDLGVLADDNADDVVE